jgi:hypothetical protein
VYAVPPGVVPFEQRADGARLCRVWALQQPWAQNWQVFEPRQTNEGWRVVARRWTQLPEEGAPDG